MSDHDRDREIERRRYNDRAVAQMSSAPLGPDGAEAIDLPLRRPYLAYEAAIRRAAGPGCRVLDLCGGSGIHSLVAARRGASVTVTDIAENGLALARLRAAAAGLSIETVVADAEDLPFPDQDFDLVTCAGGLSYVELRKLLQEITRVLRPGGGVVFIDSFNHNPVYRLNRLGHYLRGNRTLSTLGRIPDAETLSTLREVFPDLDVSYFGIGTFLVPIVRAMSSEATAARFNDWLDRRLAWAHKWAFKIVVQGRLPAVSAGVALDAANVASDPQHEYRLFRLEAADAASIPSLKSDGVYLNTLGVLFNSASMPVKLRLVTLLWFLACLSRGYGRYPRVYAVFDSAARVLIHYSFIVPAILHLSDARSEDIEIGPCWTHPSHRRSGFFKRAIQQAVRDFSRIPRQYFVLCREANRPAVRGALSAGLQSYAYCERVARKVRFFGHCYVVRSFVTESDRASARASAGSPPAAE